LYIVLEGSGRVFCRSTFMSKILVILCRGVTKFILLWLEEARLFWVFFSSHFWDRPVPIFSDVRFSYLALVQDKKSRAFYRQKHAVQFMSTAPLILHAFPFKNKQFTVYKFSIFYKHANPNNQPYYYIITFTQYTKIRN
jgi:hypothetical protein